MKIIQEHGYYTCDEDGKFHSIDNEPAIVIESYTNYTELENGIIEETNIEGYQAWYQHGQLHRIDLPAVIRNNGRQFWYENGNYIKEE